MEQSPRLSLSYIAPNQAQKHVPVNESLRRLDVLTQLTVRSRAVGAPPADPSEGEVYILPDLTLTGAWDSFSAGNLAAYQDGVWTEINAIEGLCAYVADEGALVIFDGAAWGAGSVGAPPSSGAGATLLGVNASADETNRLTVKSDAALFSNDDVTPGSGDVRINVNKSSAGNTASHLFQTGFSGRAEFGLTGDDDFHIKVSADGSSWAEALVIDNSNGNIGVGESAPQTGLHITSETSGGSRLTVERKVSNPGKGLFGALNGLFVSAREPVGTAEISFWTTISGPSDQKRMTLANDGGLYMAGASGSSKGAGTINATSVYDDNTLLTCYVFDQALDGHIDEQKWDDKVPDRIIPEEKEIDPETGKVIIISSGKKHSRKHAPMRKFKSRIGKGHDPLSLDGYARHWKEKRHLTSMPNEGAFDPASGMAAGEWIQRLVESVEIQAVLIEALNERLKALETRKAGGRGQ